LVRRLPRRLDDPARSLYNKEGLGWRSMSIPVGTRIMKQLFGIGRSLDCRDHAMSIAMMTLVSGLSACGGSSGVSNTQNTSTYTIGGGISGLTTQGLVLANGSDSVSPNAGDLNFVFPTAVAVGTSYAVTVQLQPDGLTCSVTNGSGTVGTANVTSVAVACAASSFSVGGTISGLTVSGLVLANGGSTVSPASGATSFSFNSVPADTSYNVTIATQPSGLICTVSNGTGVLLTSSVTNVAINCT